MTRLGARSSPIPVGLELDLQWWDLSEALVPWTKREVLRRLYRGALGALPRVCGSKRTSTIGWAAGEATDIILLVVRSQPREIADRL